MSEKLNACPVCEHQLEVNAVTRGDWVIYTCPNHGAFTLSNDLSVTVVRNPAYTKNIADYLKKRPSDRENIIHTYSVSIPAGVSN